MKEMLPQNDYAERAWKNVTEIIDGCLKYGKINEAKCQAKETISYWKKENETELIAKLERWLKNKNINL